MQVWLISFSLMGQDDKKLQERLHAYSIGVDHHKKYDMNFLVNSGFIDRHPDLFGGTKGDGYRAWKPYLILNAMDSAKEGDLIIYSDVVYMLGDQAVPYIKRHIRNGFFLIQGLIKNIRSTKRDCFHLMNCDSEKYLQHNQILASFCGFAKSSRTVDFLAEWLKWCTQYDVISNLPSKHKKDFIGNRFNEHHCEQSILTNLVIRHDVPFMLDQEILQHLSLTAPSRVMSDKKLSKFKKAYQ